MSDIVFLEDAIWDDNDVEIDRIIRNERGHALSVIFVNVTTGEKLNCTFKPHGIIKYTED